MEKIISLPLHLLAWIYYWLPFSIRSIGVSTLTFILKKSHIRSEVITQNLELAFPQQAQADRKRFYHEAYRHLAQLTFEILFLFGPMKRFVKKNTELRGLEYWKKVHQKGKGVLFISSHVGNWEVMAAAGAIHGGIDLMLVTKKLKPEWFHQAIERGRQKIGVKGTYEPKTLRDVLSHLKKSNGTVGFVLDQYAGPPVGVRVPVFKTPVSTSTAVAVLARRTGAAVLPVVNYRVVSSGQLKWIVEIGPALQWLENSQPDYEIASNTARYAAEIEKDIYSHPEQWLWSHKRFKGDLTPLRENEWYEGRVRN